MSPERLGQATLAVLRVLADGYTYGFDVIDRTGLPSGTVYPALAALERRGLVRSRWENEQTARHDGRPRRRYYRITPAGRRELATAIAWLGQLGLAGDAEMGTD